MKLIAAVTADITLKPSAQTAILMDPRREPRKRMVVEMVLVKALEITTATALVKALETAIAMAIERAIQKAVQMVIAPIAPMAEVPTAIPSPVVRVAETLIAIPDLSKEIPEAS